MDRLFVDNSFTELLPLCDRTVTYETDDLMHRVFCCTTRLCHYVDRTTNEEIAYIAEITKSGSSVPDKRIILRLLIGTVLYYHNFQPH
jgi:hypothetical protein